MVQRSQHLSFFIILDERQQAHTVFDRQYPDVVVHAHASSMHVEHRRVGGDNQDVHWFPENFSTSRSLTEYARRFAARLQSAMGSRANARA